MKRPKPSRQTDDANRRSVQPAGYAAGGHILGELLLVECSILSQRNTLRATIEHLEALNLRVEKIRTEIASKPHNDKLRDAAT